MRRKPIYSRASSLTMGRASESSAAAFGGGADIDAWPCAARHASGAASVAVRCPGHKLMTRQDRYRGALLGLAAGDALGTTLEFTRAGHLRRRSPTWSAADRSASRPGSGPTTPRWRCAWPRAWSSAAASIRSTRCTLRPLVPRGASQQHGQLLRHRQHVRRRARALRANRRAVVRQHRPDTAGNGSLMRLAPVPLFFAHDPTRRDRRARRTARGRRTARRGGRCLPLLRRADRRCAAGAIQGRAARADASRPSPGCGMSEPLAPAIAEIAGGSFLRREPPRDPRHRLRRPVARGGAVGVRAERHRSSDGALLAVNLGDDADTTGAVYGQIAGAYYGVDGNPGALAREAGPARSAGALRGRAGAGCERHCRCPAVVSWQRAWP